jgi:DNA-binding CsgD family transcriptional regulator
VPSIRGVDDYRRLLGEESARLAVRQRELADARAAVYQDAVQSSTGPIRQVMVALDTAPAHDDGFVRWVQADVAAGREMRTLYPSSFLQDGQAREATWLRSWAGVGERQRLSEELPHPFTVFGDDLVLAATTWGAASPDLLAIREPVVVRAFGALFEQAWRSAVPMPETRHGDEEERLCALLAAGLKDEAIARYLGLSLRTVRRRIAELMQENDAQTRFQLGSALQRQGRLDGPDRAERS